MGIVERILQIPGYYNLTVSEFSKIVGVSNGYFAKQKTNNASVGSKILEKIVKIYPEINTIWLLTGEGEIFKTKTPKNATLSKGGEMGGKKGGKRKLQKTPPFDEEEIFKTKTPKNVTVSKGNKKGNIFGNERKLQNSLPFDEEEIFKTKGAENFTLSKGEEKGEKKGEKRKLQKTSPFDEEEIRQVAFRKTTPVIYDMPEVVSMVNDREVPYIADNTVRVPVVHIDAAAGAGAFNLDFDEEAETMILPRSFLAPTRSRRCCISIRGESMEPTLLDKTRIVIRLLDRSNWGDIRNGRVYVITDREGLTYVKRVQNRLEKRGVLVLISDNPDRDRFRSFELKEEEIQHIWAVELYIADHIPPVAQRWDGVRDELETLRDRLDEMELRMK